MAILSVVSDMVGETGSGPKLIRISTTDHVGTVTTPGYLNSFNLMGNTVAPNDIAAIAYPPNIVAIFIISINNNVITLTPMNSNVIVPTITNDLVVFRDTVGLVGEAITTSVLPKPMTVTGDVKANLGSLFAYPNGAGGLVFAGSENDGTNDAIISNKAHGQATTYTFPDVGQSLGSLMNCTVASDPGANIVSFNVTVSASQLGTGQSVVLYPAASATATYILLSLKTSKGGSTWLGAGLNLIITDTVTQYTVLPFTYLQPLYYVNNNTSWGDASGGLAFPVSAAISTPTSPGQSFKNTK